LGVVHPLSDDCNRYQATDNFFYIGSQSKSSARRKGFLPAGTFGLEKIAAHRTKLCLQVFEKRCRPGFSAACQRQPPMSLLPADNPRLPKWPFLAGDAVLLGLAVLIGCYAHNPFAGRPLILITACVALGAVLATWPFIADYEQKQNEALDERQRGLEALAQTIASSAGQISIAAQSLPGIAETAAKNLSLAEQLPARPA
jgi:hypothetical protein